MARPQLPKPTFGVLETPNGAPSIGTIPDPETHGKQRKIISYAFSERALREQEYILQRYSDLLITRLHDQIKEGKGVQEVNICDWYNFTTFDVLGDLCFGASFHCLEKGDNHPWVSALLRSIFFRYYGRQQFWRIQRLKIRSNVKSWMKRIMLLTALLSVSSTGTTFSPVVNISTSIEPQNQKMSISSEHYLISCSTGSSRIQRREIRPNPHGLPPLPSNVHHNHLAHPPSHQRNGHAKPHLDPRKSRPTHRLQVRPPRLHEIYSRK